MPQDEVTPKLESDNGTCRRLWQNRPSHLLLLRHLRSTKNVTDSFSSDDDSEPLTEDAYEAGRTLAKKIARFAEQSRLRASTLYCAPSIRAGATASLIAEQLNAAVQPLDDLRSLYPGALAGVAESEALTGYPDFMPKLQLHRAGLFSSYELPPIAGREDVSHFEARIDSAINNMLSSQQSLVIACLHRSPITAVLLHFARKYHDYPVNFYGYVPLDLGALSLVKRTESHSWSIEAVNIPADSLLQIQSRAHSFGGPA